VPRRKEEEGKKGAKTAPLSSWEGRKEDGRTSDFHPHRAKLSGEESNALSSLGRGRGRLDHSSSDKKSKSPTRLQTYPEGTHFALLLRGKKGEKRIDISPSQEKEEKRRSLQSLAMENTTLRMKEKEKEREKLLLLLLREVGGGGGLGGGGGGGGGGVEREEKTSLLGGRESSVKPLISQPEKCRYLFRDRVEEGEGPLSSYPGKKKEKKEYKT